MQWQYHKSVLKLFNAGLNKDAYNDLVSPGRHDKRRKKKIFVMFLIIRKKFVLCETHLYVVQLPNTVLRNITVHCTVM
jgi:hypothetical protein